MIEGNFIVIDGIDGVGKTAQAGRLRDYFAERGLPVRLTQEPSQGPVGHLLRQVLAGRVVVPGIQGPRPPSWNTMAALFAADRLDHLESEIVPNLLDGVNIVCDRYDYSSLAFQTLTSGGNREETTAWVRSLNHYARRPDLSIILDIDPGVAAERRNKRSLHREIYEHDALQKELAAFYRDIDMHFPGDHIVHIDATGDEMQVAQAIREHVRMLRGETRGSEL